MADKTTTTSTLQIVSGYADGDDRTINLENPNTALDLGARIYDIETFTKQKQVIIGDKAGAAFTGFKSAKIVNKTVTKFDLG